MDIRNIGQFIKVDKDGNVDEFIMLPNIKDIRIILGHTANYAMIEAIICISDYSNIKCESKIKYFENKINDVDKHYNL